MMERTIRVWMLAAVPLTAAWLVAAVIHFAVLVIQLEQPSISIGIDRRLYLDAAQGWLATGSFYPDWQLAGPYAVDSSLGGAILYPPSALPLFVVGSVVPWPLWWILPLGVTLWSVAALRPARWTWPILAFLVWWPRSEELVLWGNPGMYALMAVALAARGKVWAGPLVLLKPTLGPLALFGMWKRQWWSGLALLVLLSLPFGALWTDWFHAVTSITNQGLSYSLAEVPLLLLPIVAWAGRGRNDQSVLTPMSSRAGLLLRTAGASLR